LIIYKVGTYAYTLGNNIFNEVAVDDSSNARSVEVTITSSMSAKQLANLFYEKGLVAKEKLFYYQIIASDYNGDWLDGTYTLTTDMLPTELLETISTASTSSN
ncbi:MAG: hypothetical protein K6F41_01030, partial [Lachnospira sp.]|nr:hypothetical protein [Lachnospira sp.]